MEKQIRREIEHQARKLLRRRRIEIWAKQKSRIRFEKRTGQPATKKLFKEPAQWRLHPHFNPIYCIKHSKFLARVIWQKLRDNEFKPQPALKYEIPKQTGGTRTVMVFSIPDGAVAGLFHRRMTKRNVNILSSNNYSYRPDRNIFDAIINMKSALEGENTFIIQYDFKKYFDTISHNYIKSLIYNIDLFLISEIERNLITSFLIHEYASREDYKVGEFQRRTVGVPQGSSISLFLSNIAGHELDKDLEKHDGQFIRFADDVVAVTYNYEEALGVSEVFAKHCARSGVEVNRDKSPGIYILSDVSAREMRTVKEFDYLGHKFRRTHVLLSDRSIRRIKKRISNMIYIHLLQSPVDRKLFNAARIGTPFYDWDLVTCVNEVRRYIYGSLSQSQLRNFVDKNVRLPRMRGLMSFYPLVTNCEQLRRLDGWLVSALYRAQRERCKALKSMGYSIDPISKGQLIRGDWHVSPNPLIGNESACPSFVYAWRAARKYFIRYGLSGISPPGYYSSDDRY